ncbi:50S ribosomal protein L22 [Paulownia witches'-broom phytoplasma]|uniref:Large ribosomal subunit protein uL22 n=12 Tax=Candidatus Phytoplasma TaxID=33926 RepID=F8QWM1_9MOLU|nr:50S ribosomal protein L22 [Paulownia witches'-broom phytoplasma]AAL57842.1 ribosomal protein L22 [Phytoplasma sp. PY1]ADX60665.1 ribosomal protein L22 [Peach yellow leaf phytoplasma]AEJ73234.1 ribosomal protein L22 [Chinese potato phytoplasma]AFN01657.1 Rpl22 [Balsamine virescence phytoplasma]AFU52876.1 ribosomal protein L22 [Cabbage witches'-broom phytoplasma]AGG68952.1 ribosomal protein L22 ['Rosa xanthina' witches'-broom phytoplasma]AYC63431.1 Rpl22 [Willow phyllody phytoplasma]WMV975
METKNAKAITRKVSIAPRKARLVVDLIRGKNIAQAQAILTFTPKVAAPVILKLLNSAVSNAVNNLKLNREQLYVKEVFVNEGLRLKRMFPRAKGSGDMIKKRTSHITLVITSSTTNLQTSKEEEQSGSKN